MKLKKTKKIKKPLNLGGNFGSKGIKHFCVLGINT